MSFLNQNIPPYLYDKKNLIKLVFFTALFALVFINIYKPFSSFSWYKVSEFKFLIFSSLIILTGVLIVVISRIIMYHFTKRGYKITYGGYISWIFAEIFFMSLFYTIYTQSVNDDRDLMETFKSSSINTSLVLLIPYSVSWLYFSWKDKELKLQQIEESHLENGKNQIITFNDEKGGMRLSIKKDHLLYLESADNYVNIWYMNKGNITKFMLRNSLKNMEDYFKDTSILRCHRSFMVNFDQVKVLRKEKEGIFLELGIDKVPDIPISKTYSEKVTNWFLKHSS